ncbi:MAG: hypothetical protein HZC28_06135 [Spirochaetes bacterium]|nr:hypothetical protein [Spirochaetota bacterium]
MLYLRLLRFFCIGAALVNITFAIENAKDMTMKLYAVKDMTFSKKAEAPGAVYYGFGITAQTSGGYSYIKPELYAFINAGKKDDTAANSTQLVLRNGKAYISLVRIDEHAIPADMQAAYFTFRPHFLEKSGGYTLSFHRMLTPWDAAATWNRPSSDGKPWTGLKGGVDYDVAPFATYTAETGVKSPTAAPGFADALRKWASGEWRNNGFAVFINGECVQMNISTETNSAAVAKNKKAESVLLDADTSYACVLNDTVLKALVLERDDLTSCRFNIRIAAYESGGDAELGLYRLIKPLDADAVAESEPFAAIQARELTKGDNIINITKAALRWYDGSWANNGFIIRLKVNGASPKIRIMTTAFSYDREKKLSHFLLSFRSRESVQLFSNPVIPTAGLYTRTVNGKIMYGDKRLRLWGVCRHDSENLFTAERIKRLGFNAVRIWGPRETGWYDDASIKTPAVSASGEGTGTAVDRYDRFFAECKRLGLFVMFPGLHGPRFPDTIFSDDSFLRGSEGEWDEWKAALAESKKAGLDNRHYSFFDERMKRYFFTHAQLVLNHVNPYTGKRYAEEEAICMYEVNNENGFLQWMLVGNRIEKLPAYFKAKLMKRWCTWLITKYTDDAGVVRAWGTIMPGESLASSSYALAPAASEAGKYPKQRGADLVEFMVSLVVSYNTEFIAMCRAQAPKGIGVNVAPIISDTQFMKNIPWMYANAAASDAVSFGIYMFTLSSSLTKPPAFYTVDHLTVKDKATVIYEFNAGRPNPYRAEWAYKMALFAAWQDWDGAFFHYFNEPRSHGLKTGDDVQSHEEYISSKQWTPDPNFPQGAPDASFGDGVDPAKYSAFAIAGRIFLSGAIHPAPSPTEYRIGPSGYDSYDYMRGIGELTAATAFTRGARISFQPKQQDALAIGGDWSTNAVSGPVSWNNGEVVWDWENGRVIVDTPSAKAYVGVPGTYRFRDGITLSGVDAPFVAFGMTTENGTPLLSADKNTKILTSAVFDSQNLGFSIDMNNVPDGGPFIHPAETAKRTGNTGLPPAILTPVPYLLSFPKSFTATLSGYDYALRRVESAELNGKNIIDKSTGQALFASTLRIVSWGAAAPEKVIEVTRSVSAGTSGSPKRVNVPFWNIIPGMDWNADYRWAHQLIRDGSIPFGGISKFIGDAAAQTKSITVNELVILKDTTANVSLIFNNDSLTRIDVEFVKPPVYSELVTHCRKNIGVAPVKEVNVTTAATASSVDWEVKDAKTGLTMLVTVKEMQGVISFSAEIK